MILPVSLPFALAVGVTVTQLHQETLSCALSPVDGK